MCREADKLSPDEVSLVLHAFVKLDAPTHAPDEFYTDVHDMLSCSLRFLADSEVSSCLDAEGLHRALLAVTMWGPVPDEVTSHGTPLLHVKTTVFGSSGLHSPGGA